MDSDFLTFLAVIIPLVIAFVVVSNKLHQLGIWVDGNQMWNDNKERCWRANGCPGDLWSFDPRGKGRRYRRQQRGNSRNGTRKGRRR